jgi:hypothetical protein
MGWVVNATPRPLYPRERDPVPIVQEVGWVTGPVWTVRKNSTSPGFDPRNVQPVASSYTDWDTPAHIVVGKVPRGNMATLRKTEFFHLEIAGKVRTYHGWCLDRSFVCITKKRSLMKSHWVWRCKSFPKSLQLAILWAPLRVIWPMSAHNVSSQNFFKPCVQLMLFVKAQSTSFFIDINNAFWFVHYC